MHVHPHDNTWAIVTLLAGGGAVVGAGYAVTRYVRRVRKQVRVSYWRGYADSRRDLSGRGPGSLTSLDSRREMRGRGPGSVASVKKPAAS